MNPHQAADSYRALGLAVRRVDDEPGHLYRYHQHAQTYLFSISGVGLIKLGTGQDATLHVVRPGEELVVEAGVMHGGVAGPDGWSYLVAQEP